MEKVRETNIRLENEVEERKTAEAALSKAHNELEARVQERTEQLWLSLEQTRQARKQLTGVVTSVSDGLLVTDLEGNLQLLNASAEALFNCNADECLGQPLKRIIKDPALLIRMEEALHLHLADFRIEFAQISPNLQKTIFLLARTSIISGSRGEATGMIFLIQDISHEREMERIKSEFISTAVHELSTPLTAIMGYSELLLSGQEFSPADSQEFLAIINEKAEFLTSLVSDMLDISRIESGKPLELNRNPNSAEELFERPIHHFRHFSNNHKFVVNITEPQMKLATDREKIWQVMENLCSNAVKYSPDGGEIEVFGRPYQNGYQVSISDRGIGMTHEQLTRVFEKFYRCNQSNTAVGGTGLGMTIVKGIIEAHDGQIWLDSELGQGTSVHFVLPCGTDLPT
jgi:PAS domain S-box-containing protein